MEIGLEMYIFEFFYRNFIADLTMPVQIDITLLSEIF